MIWAHFVNGSAKWQDVVTIIAFSVQNLLLHIIWLNCLNSDSLAIVFFIAVSCCLVPSSIELDSF